MSPKMKITLQDSFKLALSLSIGYGIALALDWDLPRYVGLAITVISLDTLGGALGKAAMRVVGTTVAVFFGLFALACLAQNAWGTYVFFAVYLIVMAYMIQTSKHDYVYFISGFVALLIWATAYGTSDMSVTGFHYAMFRYLETVTGILVYMLVHTLLWPRSSGVKLVKIGEGIFSEFTRLFKALAGQLQSGKCPDEIAELRGKLPGAIAKWQALLDSAQTDTPKVKSEKKVWDDLRVQIRAFADAMELWAESIPDVSESDLASLLPGLEPGLGAMEQRLEQIGSLWQESLSLEGDAALNKATENVAPLNWTISEADSIKLSNSDRCRLMSFVNQLQTLDAMSCKLVHTLRVLVGFETTRGYQRDTETANWYRRVLWDPHRLKWAASPAICFTVAWVFWIYANPPGGNHIPFLAGLLALHQVVARWNAIQVLVLFLFGIFVVMGPVYIFVMPALSTGPQLLALIFVYAFLAGLAGSINPFIKMVCLILFVELSGLSNTHQVYSFLVLADVALVFMMTFGIVALVNMFWTPAHPGRVMLGGLRRFFLGCARVTEAMRIDPDQEHRRIKRRHTFNTMIRPALAELQSTSQHLDDRQYPANDGAKVRQLLYDLESINSRLLALELIQERAERYGLDGLGTMGDVAARLREQLKSAFERWSRGEITAGLTAEKAALEQIAADVEQQLNAAPKDAADGRKTAEDRYTVLGIARSLVAAMARTQQTLETLDLQQWAVTRF